MRVLIAHEAAAGAGGVESYLRSIVPVLLARGHEVAFLHDNPASEVGPVTLRWPGVPAVSVSDEGLPRAIDRARAWGPDACFSHNMRQLAVDEALIAVAPTVKMMHGYFGTCISGQKTHGLPAVTACGRPFGPMCLALYLPRQCGRRTPAGLFGGYRWASAQRDLLGRYAHVIVASAHMGREYRQGGVPAERLTIAPLFPTMSATGARESPAAPSVLFAGRMTRLKGGDVLVRAVAAASRILSTPVGLVMAGDGPERPALERLASSVDVRARFTGWLPADALAQEMRAASVVAVPSLWPEPFGLVGLEAGVHGVPSAAFDVGGISEWLHDGVNGKLVRRAGDAEGLGAAVAAIAGDSALNARLGAGARAMAAEMSLAGHVDRVEAVLRAVAA
jgi:glycosyltransferase involved in cell wall biosynthesis